MRRLTGVALCLAALGGAGCAHEDSPWDPVGGTYDSGNWFGPRISMKLPPDWMKRNFVKDGLVATRDGWNLQTISIGPIEPGKPLAHTKKVVTKGMRPNELAEVLLDDLRASGASSLKIVETRPVTLAGLPGFRATVAFKDSRGLRMKAVLCGVLRHDRGWRVSYVAPARHYFELDLATFDEALATFQIR